MKNSIQEIKEKYDSLTIKLDEVTEKEKQISERGEQLAFDYKICDEAFEDAKNHFDKIEKTIEKRKKNFVEKNYLKRLNKINGGIIAASLLGTGVLNLFGIPAQYFFAAAGSILLSCVYSIADMIIFHDKCEEKYLEQFEGLESTERIRNTSDVAYVNQLRKEEELKNIQGKIIDNTKELNETKTQKREIENQIIDTKLNGFDHIFGEKIIEGPTLKLK